MPRPDPLPEPLPEPLRREHLPAFLALVKGEGWLSEQWELDFLIASFPDGCLAVVHEGVPVGFVTAVQYGTSGWIGNLLVAKELRGRGLGRLLMEEALTSLGRAGAGTVWLTASRDGQALYEKLGFTAIDRIVRWQGSGFPDGEEEAESIPPETAAALDRLGWGDDRGLLLRAVAGRGPVLGMENGFCIVQGGEQWSQIGPWGCRDRRAAAGLLRKALAFSGERNIFADCPEGNRHVSELLADHGFAPFGTTTLMYRGNRPDYRADHVFALASMGSMG